MSTLVKSKTSPSLRSMMEDFWSPDRFFSRSFPDTFLNAPFFNREFLPAVNVRETKNHYELEFAVPGFKKDDFKVETENGVLTISAETKDEENYKKEEYTRQEFSYASFTRTFNLPDDVIEDNIKANYHNGVLTLELKKSGKQLTAKKAIKVD
ncbi:hypothetical protein BEL04_06415 [Mucilaginibacter sp. PPCGB 2223]|nr:hypothetical protein BEL04_06415 [Mucilaginibacter sp. PPCGB 2223]